MRVLCRELQFLLCRSVKANALSPFLTRNSWMGWFRSDPLEEIVGLDTSYHGGCILGDSHTSPEYISAYKERKKQKRLSRGSGGGLSWMEGEEDDDENDYDYKNGDTEMVEEDVSSELEEVEEEEEEASDEGDIDEEAVPFEHDVDEAIPVPLAQVPKEASIDDSGHLSVEA